MAMEACQIGGRTAAPTSIEEDWLVVEGRAEEPQRSLCARCPVLIHVEGNIGSGKTTLMEHMQKRSHAPHSVLLVPEPLDRWETILNTYYRQLTQVRSAIGTRSGPTTQEMYEAAKALDTMIFSHHEDVVANLEPKVPKIVERSLKSTLEVFGALRKELDMVETCFFDELRARYEELMRVPEHRPTVVLYCESTVSEAYQRIRKRGRQFETECIDLGYLGRLEKKYQEVFQPGMADNVVVFDGSQPFEQEVNKVRDDICRVMRRQGCDPQQVDAVVQFLTPYQASA